MPKWGSCQYDEGKEREDARYDIQGFDAVVRTIGELLSEGKIKHWGLSNETVRPRPFVRRRRRATLRQRRPSR